MASFLALVVDATTKKIFTTLTSAEIRCFEKRCDMLIKSELLRTTNEIHWLFSKCANEGKISGWQKTKWDNRQWAKIIYKFKNGSKNIMTALSY
jgi:hypothetical protein